MKTNPSGASALLAASLLTLAMGSTAAATAAAPSSVNTPATLADVAARTKIPLDIRAAATIAAALNTGMLFSPECAITSYEALAIYFAEPEIGEMIAPDFAAHESSEEVAKLSSGAILCYGFGEQLPEGYYGWYLRSQQPDQSDLLPYLLLVPLSENPEDTAILQKG
jgi:hypothetical protein